MKSLLSGITLFISSVISAQKALPDSVIREFARLTCECATLMKVDEGTVESGISNLGTCINTNMGLYIENGWIKKEWLDDSAWAINFDNAIQDEMGKNCPAFKTLVRKSNAEQVVPEPLDETPEKYFLTAESMTKKGFEFNPNAKTGMMRRWSSKNLGTANIQMVFDIRMVFKNADEAKEYYLAKMGELSEGGERTSSSLNEYGVDASLVFGANPKLMNAFGDLDMAQYNFVFRVKNVVAKVFVSTNKKTTYAEAVVFAKEAIQRIKNAAL